MKATPFAYLFVALVLLSSCADRAEDYTVTSPDGNVEVGLSPSDSGLFYTVLYQDDTVLLPSRLGLVLEDEDLSVGLEYVSSSDVSEISEAYTMHHGKQRSITYEANERRFDFRNPAGSKLSLIFRVSDDGVGFRYVLPDSSVTSRVIKDEKTEYTFPTETKSWLQPMSVAKTGWEQTNPSYEEFYQKEIPVGTPSPLGVGWVYPALFQTGDTWLLITETALDQQYAGTKLVAKPNTTTMKVAFPQAEEVWPGRALLPNAKTPWMTPWRVVTIGSLGTIVESTLGTDLADPAIQVDTTLVKPGYASWSWVLLKDNFTRYDVQKEFVDYAADMNWQYTLVDADWDTTIGYERVAELADYAEKKGIGLLLWYNSAGPWNTTPYHPKSKLLTHEQRVAEFSKLRDMGIRGVKIDFFGGDGQSMISYYHDILRDAAEYGLLVNFHGSTLPRGWSRTYPNLMTAEAIKGEEFVTFFQENADEQPTHAAMLPFTRNAFDPMDFTPMVLDSIPNIHRRTTSGFELALPTLFLSGIQHMAEIPTGMAKMPEFVKEYLRNLPTQWDKTRFLSGYPGKDVVIARRSGDTWWISGINGEAMEKEVALDLSFVQGEGLLITDGADGKTLTEKSISVGEEKIYPITMRPNGGFVMKMKGS